MWEKEKLTKILDDNIELGEFSDRTQHMPCFKEDFRRGYNNGYEDSLRWMRRLLEKLF